MNHSTSHNQTCCCDQNNEKTEISGVACKTKKTFRAMFGTVLSFLIAFFPKCPLCWAAYMSMVGSVGLSNIPYAKWLLPVLIGLLLLHLVLILRRIKIKGYGPFVCSLAGALIIICGKLILPIDKWLLILGMILILAGSLWNNFSMKNTLVFKLINLYHWRRKNSY